MTDDSYLGKMISDLTSGTILCCYKKPLLSKMVSSGSGYFRFACASGMDNVQRNMGHFVPQLNLTYCTFQVFNIRYQEMHKVQGSKCEISMLMNGLSMCTNDNHSLMLVVYRLVHTDDSFINLHVMYTLQFGF